MSDGQTPYDKVIYPEGAYPIAHPERMAVVAMLMGLQPPPLENARILELGCGTGGHLIALALEYPNTTCVGIDYAKAQVAIAHETIEAVGLTNITIHALDFIDVPDDIGQFDYIIAHGIFSWIPEATRHRLLDILHRNLVPNGVAYLSYNTFPGWRILQLAADLMRIRVSGIEDPVERARVAREVVSSMAELPAHTNVESMWTRFMETYHSVWGMLKDYLELKTDHVLLHDDLEETSRPFYFHEILGMLPQHHLVYLADASFPSNLLFGLKPEEATWLSQMAPTFEETEQYLDFLRNRTFRTSLLVHDSASFTRSVTPLPVANFYVASYVRRTNPQPEGMEADSVHYSAAEGLGFVTNDAVMIATLDLLVEAEGTPVAFRELVRRARERAYAYSIPASTLEEDAHKIATTLLTFYSKSTNMLEFTTLPGPYVTHLSERPVASRYARYQAISGDTVTNMRHNRVNLSTNARALISLLDGTNTRERLVDTLMRMTLQPEGVPESERRATMTEEVDRLMDRFRIAALLVG